MQSDIDIRPATEGDVDALSHLLVELFNIEKDFFPDQRKHRRGLLLLTLQRDKACIYVAEHKNKIVAMCSVQIVISSAEGGRSAWVEDVIVSHRYRRQGIATLLLEQVERWCREHDVSRIQLLADEDNPGALKFYHHQGWQATNLKAWRKPLSDS